jgi:hypothetical protein
MLPESNSSSITVPGIAETQPPAAEPPMPAADINLLVQIRLGLNHRDTFSLPKCLPLASGDFSTTEVSTFVSICKRGP